MVYITVRQSPMYHQMTLEEFLFGVESHSSVINYNSTNTRTYEVNYVSERFKKRLGIDIQSLIYKLAKFNESTEELRKIPRKELYRSFHIPKKSGGLRKIDAPEPDLMDALRRLKTIFEDDFKALYHTSAFAYVKHRCTVDAVKRHQANESKWFGKYDLSNFFGSTTIDFAMKMIGMVYPFSEVAASENGERELRKAIDLAFLNGGLPQGTPISPLITNIMMIPIDYRLANGFRNLNVSCFEESEDKVFVQSEHNDNRNSKGYKDLPAHLCTKWVKKTKGKRRDQHFIYTRYADDFLVSSKYDFDFKDVERFIVDTLKSFDAPFTIKSEKTRYGSSAGKNWNLGVMLNKDNKITVGHQKKRQFQAMLASYVMDKKNGITWDLSDVQTMEGYRNYYRMVEGEAIDKIVEHIGKKFNVNIVQMIKDDLRV